MEMPDYLNADYDHNSAELVEVFDELPLWAAPFGLKLLDHIRYRKGIMALDVGFGAGFPLTELAMRLDQHSKVYGIDPWEPAVARAEKKIACYGISNVEIIRGVAEFIPLPDKSIDLIVSNNGLNNVQNISEALRECNRVMKPAGQFVQTMNLEGSMSEFYTSLEKVLMDTGQQEMVEAMNAQIHQLRKPLDEYLMLIESHGYSIESVIHDEFQYRFVDATTMFNHYFIRMAFLDGWKSIVPGDRQAEVFTRVEKLLNEQAEATGSLTLTIPFVLIDGKKA